MRYMLLMLGEESAEEIPAVMPDTGEPCWMPWAREMEGRSVVLLDGARLQPSRTATTVRASGTEPSFCLISPTTEPRSRPDTLAPTSRYLESPCRSMALGLGCNATVATSPSLM